MARFIIVLSALLLSPMIMANDSIVAIDNTGMQLLGTSQVVMESEDLMISEAAVKVTYRFKNLSKQNLVYKVGFPFPPIEKAVEADTCCYEGDKNPMGFKGTSDGKPLKFKVHKSDGTTTFSYTYYWDQVFPAGKTITVTHEYRPNVGGMAFNPFQQNSDLEKVSLAAGFAMLQRSDDGLIRHLMDTYCIDKSTFGAIAKSKKFLMTSELSYILTTGNNWAGPIRDFKLTIKKSKPDQIISFCGDGVKKIDPLTFVTTKKNFVPTKELNVAWFGSGKYY